MAAFSMVANRQLIGGTYFYLSRTYPSLCYGAHYRLMNEKYLRKNGVKQSYTIHKTLVC
jgi:hypothetical protein